MRLGVLDIGSDTGHLMVVDHHFGSAPPVMARTCVAGRRATSGAGAGAGAGAQQSVPGARR